MGVFQHWPNRITALRFLGSMGLFGIFALHGMQGAEEVRQDARLLVWAFWLFLLTSLSDVLDGYLARRGNHVTAFGRIADPFVDKVLVLGAMVFLAVMPWSREWFPAWIVVVVLAREFLITAIRGYVESQGGQFPADWFGKLKMFAQCIAVGVTVGMFAFRFEGSTFALWSQIAHIAVWATLITSVGSCLSYLVKIRRFILEGSS
ncbi:MAG: CDP-diacylglycerol--glycerol-3-phosphate 3-phosphatidyltransferase [Planctomycetes bacterium]|nr:CDP-diacylglycerol--glycerol-3-phosphate 3-phosphatidyltransferase [Planctomycetota bacterium]